MTAEQIIETLRHPPTKLPREELAEVVRRREEFVPLLIAEIENATRLGDGMDLDDLLMSFALYLLAEMREPRALAPILELFALDERTEQDLFADMITESGSQILAAVGHDNPRALREYAKRADISQWVRAAALDALVCQAAWGEQPRETVVRFFAELIGTNQFGDDWESWTWLVSACLDLHPRELLEPIRNLYKRRLVDAGVLGDFEDIETEATRDFASHWALRRKMRPPITDAAESVSAWQYFREPSTPQRFQHAGPFDLPSLPEVPGVTDVPKVPHATVRNEPKPGRNDLCPCGSGRKYKKCCLNKG